MSAIPFEFKLESCIPENKVINNSTKDLAYLEVKRCQCILRGTELLAIPQWMSLFHGQHWWLVPATRFSDFES
jgi:hypothetical protein